MINIRRRRAVRGVLATVAATVALAATAGTSFASGDPVATAERARAAAGAEQQQAGKAQGAAPASSAVGTVETPSFAMMGVTKQAGDLYMYWTDDQGGFKPREFVTSGFDAFADSIDVDNDKDGWSDHSWTVYKGGKLTYSWIDDDDFEYHSNEVGKGWNIYPTILSPGSIGGAQEADLIGLDKAGVLWGYLGYSNGTLTPRIRIGGGWGQYTQLAGQGDLTGDNKPDIVARDTSGVLWLYKGTGNYKAPFASRTRIGGGWNTYDRLLSVGDLNADGVADLVARKPNGDLFRYSGTGRASAVFQSPVKIGHGFQIYNLL